MPERSNYLVRRKLETFFLEFGNLLKFTGRTLSELFSSRFEWREFYKQSYRIGVKTWAIIGISAFILGLVLSIQLQPVFVDFGAESWIPGMVALSIVKEIGPVITGLICAGKIGSGLGAEIGSMRVTEQIDAMEVSATNPMKYITATRVLATTLMVPILVIYADAISLFGSLFAVNINSNVSITLFFYNVFETIKFTDVYPSLIKSLFFGAAIGIVGCYKGYYAHKGTEGVGNAANAAVVIASLSIFVIDMIAVQLEQLL